MAERPKGYIFDWNPRTATREIITQILIIMQAFAAEELLPTSIRAVLYRLVALAFPKTEHFYQSLIYIMTMMRRYRGEDESLRLPMEWVTDFNAFNPAPWWHQKPADFINNIHERAENYTEDRQAGQERRIIVWTEAAGLVAACERACDPYGIRVVSSGGQDSLSLRGEISREINQSDVPTSIWHIGDHDGQGHCIFDTIREDVPLLAMRSDTEVRRLAVREEQIEDLGLATREAKGTAMDQKYDITEACEAEAIDLRVLRDMITDAIHTRFDMDVYKQVLAKEEYDRQLLIECLNQLPNF